jgi:signal transduction histidine kinase
VTATVPGAEQRLISRTWRSLAVQTALVFAVAFVGLDVLAIGVVLYTSHADSRRTVSQAIADPDVLTAPPTGIRVYKLHHGQLSASSGAGAQPVDPAALSSVAPGAQVGPRQVRQDGREYLVQTQRRGTDVIQVALDLTVEEHERHRLFLALAAAGAAGLALAALVGAVIARRAIAPLGQALARQRRFVADASHELRTPLTQLHLRAQLLEREVLGAADSRYLATDAGHLVRGTRQLGELVEELLLAAQLQAEPARFGPVDLAALAREAAEDERVRAQERGVAIEVRVSRGGHIVRGVPSAIRRVLGSLLDNALAHTTSGIWLEVAGDPDTRLVTATVRDDGAGLDPAQADRLFERFARGNHADSRRFGLGLALVKEVVTAHGGEVTVSGRPGEGAAFTITLPAWPQQPEGGPG